MLYSGRGDSGDFPNLFLPPPPSRQGVCWIFIFISIWKFYQGQKEPMGLGLGVSVDADYQ